MITLHLNNSIFLYFIFFIPFLEAKSEIYLTIKGQGNQLILNKEFYKEPSQVLVDGMLDNSCKWACDLKNEINNITLIFDKEINSCKNMFKGLTNLLSINLSNFDSSRVTNMNSMFFGCTNLKKIIFGNIVTSSVQDMTSLFENCENLIFVDLSNFNTSSVTTMNGMFRHCVKMVEINASSFTI